MTVTILRGDCREVLKGLEAGSVHMVATSPPYWKLRSYLDDGDPLKEYEIGGEPTPDLYVQHLVEVMREVWRVLRDDGTAWMVIGDSYASSSFSSRPGGKGDGITGDKAHFDIPRPPVPDGLKPKDLCMIPARVALALQADGWWVRSQIVWAKGVSFCKTYSGSCMPESVRDRPTTSYEMVYLLSKSARYFYDQEAVKEVNVSPAQLRHNQKYAQPYAAYDSRGGPSGTGQPGNENNRGIHSRPGSLLGGRNLRSVFVIPDPLTEFLKFCETQGVDAGALWDAYQDGQRGIKDTWAIGTSGSKRKHYAAYPEALVRPMILAGTSAYGCCAACGAGWERVQERRNGEPDSYHGSHFDRGKTGVHQGGRAQEGQRGHTVMIGWRPGCQCDAGPPIPATVLDPFVGSGSTCHVAESLGRDSIGIDLSSDYVEMARHRVNRTEETETVLNGQAVTVEQVPMWEVAGCR